jgi:hypothetical protein
LAERFSECSGTLGLLASTRWRAVGNIFDPQNRNSFGDTLCPYSIFCSTPNR